MNKLQVVLGTVALGAALVGCSDTSALNQKVDALLNKVEALSNDVEALKSSQAQTASKAQAAYDEAVRANERLDNLSNKYKK
ncbi:Lpp/OprI family alanine-zipper lipoprotein [Ruminobacter sp. RM87]|uniref:Lpp/OprI family alanine-zipper lipoprotein n=1 Tax=Ruminobacter sp. RM87 TaxID=1200567 RepID=UPI0004E166E4|nr:Lpp/OprI family alanine-zipper lipoprotein [Ruminobacter sp. RM87]